ncbi:hypothetical protein GLOTRDRAFT_96839 [Gloeophyllum trabeum ATCC 11539]|uniref:Uncharacterized protein n=1 Tax=Gloeophyllum trabeum (strain ATCC 11539 / FP-39264 / Madison 617) TaxID=670483 RepID=S7REM9_GLOTA|nr:uncharacterized protein GLOTRDRAFT_96839 [Gloeophyllum trabeum ATCC 11539]EPQ50939.1 hypothetical protein GLOTRDRAFT_96839 [Gloeophyllum trabeum ATCC 11539]
MAASLDIGLIESFNTALAHLSERKGPTVANTTLKTMSEELSMLVDPKGAEGLDRLMLETILTDIEILSEQTKPEAANTLLRHFNRQVKAALFERVPAIWGVWFGRRVGIFTSQEEMEVATKHVPVPSGSIGRFFTMEDAIAEFKSRLLIPNGITIWTDPKMQNITVDSDPRLVYVPPGREELREKMFGVQEPLPLAARDVIDIE